MTTRMSIDQEKIGCCKGDGGLVGDWVVHGGVSYEIILSVQV